MKELQNSAKGLLNKIWKNNNQILFSITLLLSTLCFVGMKNPNSGKTRLVLSPDKT